MLFINTTSSGYETDPISGVKSLTLQKGENGTIATGTIKVALLSLGQSGDSYTSGSSDAADLGDFYQWGRVADGHQKTVWSKDAISHLNIINNPTFGQPNGTSGVVGRPTMLTWGTNSNFPDSYEQVPNNGSADNYLGKFITYNIGDWHTDGTSPTASKRWGSGTTDRATAADTAKTGNDPCPSSWKVPSGYNWWDSSVGNGSGNLTTSSCTYANATNNTWQWRGLSTNGGAIGGALITNAAGERVFCPLPVIASPIAVR
ncbi:MAG: hypothetical protein LBT04_01835 [Prevotellaceae bacterium]|jgi:hypothetical protein|nr:hypothetical protein [Prevotellaceae bacterium]